MFMHEHVRMILHEWQIELGMLTAYETSYYPSTEYVVIKTEKTGNGSKVQETEIGTTMHSKDQTDKETPTVTSEKPNSTNQKNHLK